MSDNDVQWEIESNNQRKAAAEDDGTLVDLAERVVDPFTDAMARDRDESPAEGVDRQRRENNEAQKS